MQRKTQLALRTKLSVAEAEEQVYVEYMDMRPQSRSSCVKQQKATKPKRDIDETLPYPLNHQESESPEAAKSYEPIQATSSLDPDVVNILHQGQEQQQRRLKSRMLLQADLVMYDENPLTFLEF